MFDALKSRGTRHGKCSAPALTENHNVVQSSSPGLPRVAGATPGYTPQNPTANCEAVQSAKFICGHPIRPISPLPPHPKSTVDLGCEPLIRVENGLRSPLSPTRHKPIIRPENKGIKPKSNRHRPKNFTLGRYAWWQATSVATRKHPCGVRSYVLTFLHIKSMKPIVGYCSLFQPIPAFLTPPREALPWP